MPMTSAPTSTAPLALLAVDGPIARITLNRAESRNALSPELLAALHGVIDELHARCKAEPISVAVITGAGKAFCAGMDLKLVLGNAILAEELLLSLALFTHKLRLLPAITYAVVNGAAIGGGCGLATVCDLGITHADSKMGFPEVDLGVCPAVVAPWLTRKIGVGPARRVLLSGGLMSGIDAHACGIVTELVQTAADLVATSEVTIARLAQSSPGALRATKALLNELDGSLDEAILRKAAAVSAAVLNTEQTQVLLRKKMGM